MGAIGICFIVMFLMDTTIFDKIGGFLSESISNTINNLLNTISNLISANPTLGIVLSTLLNSLIILFFYWLFNKIKVYSTSACITIFVAQSQMLFPQEGIYNTFIIVLAIFLAIKSIKTCIYVYLKNGKDWEKDSFYNVLNRIFCLLNFYLIITNISLFFGIVRKILM